MRSMYSSVSALRAHQTRMDVIGNNIANVNTPGYKTSKANFATAFSQTLAGAGGSSDTGRGGTNPMQVGLGANLSAITTYHRQGGTQRTDNQTDLMIGGNGYFVLSPDSSGEQKYYTRAGNFIVDEKGYLVSSTGYKVLDKDFKPVFIDRAKTENAKPTTKISVKGNIDFDAKTEEKLEGGVKNQIAYATTVDVYDSVGKTHTMQIRFGKKYTTPPSSDKYKNFSFRMIETSFMIPPAKEGDDPTYTDVRGTLNPNAMKTSPTGANIDSPMFAMFDNEGNFVRVVQNVTIEDPTKDPKQIKIDVFDAGITNDTARQEAMDKITIGTDVTSALSPSINPEGAETITLNFAETFKDLHHYSKSTALESTAVDGKSAGSVKQFTISPNGDVVASYTNGEQSNLASIVLADFSNPSGLMSIGGNMFAETDNSGVAKYGKPTAGGFGELTPGALEMSNVDLSAEFTDMITTQRGFQANSRVVTTSDEILQELVNLKR